MKKRTSLEEIPGKTVETAGHLYKIDGLVITFDDGTFISLGVVAGYDAGYYSIEEMDINPLDAPDELVALNVCTEQEVKDLLARREQETQRVRESLQRQEYDRLRSIYEPK